MLNIARCQLDFEFLTVIEAVPLQLVAETIDQRSPICLEPIGRHQDIVTHIEHLWLVSRVNRVPVDLSCVTCKYCKIFASNPKNSTPIIRVRIEPMLNWDRVGLVKIFRSDGGGGARHERQ